MRDGWLGIQKTFKAGHITQREKASLETLNWLIWLSSFDDILG